MSRTLTKTEKSEKRPAPAAPAHATGLPSTPFPIDPEDAFSRERINIEKHLSEVALNLYKKLREPDSDAQPNKMIARVAPINRNSPNPNAGKSFTREKAAQLVYVMAKDAIERKDQATLNQLGVKDCFFQLSRDQAFALCVLCLEHNHENAFKKIIRAFPELCTWQSTQGLTQGMSLIHLAARLDRDEIIQYLLTKDKQSGELKDINGDTFLHTAVRYNARKVIDRTMQLRTILFAQINKQHQRPGDLQEPGAVYIKDLTHNMYLQAVLRNAQARASKTVKSPRRPKTGMFEFVASKT